MTPKNMYYLALTVFALGGLSVIFAAFTGVGEVVYVTETGIEKDVGYFSAINWWPNYIVLVPLLLILVGILLSMFEFSLESCFKAGMFVYKESGNPVTSSEEIVNLWRKTKRKAYPFWIVSALLVFGATLYDLESATVDKNTTLDNIEEVDWSVAHILKKSVDKRDNDIFTYYAFIMQAIGASASLSILVLALAIGAFMFGLPYWSRPRILLVVDESSSDSRKGFERFEPVATVLFFSSLVSMLMLYLVVLWNTYIQRPDLASLYEIPLVKYSLQAEFGSLSIILAVATGLLIVVSVSIAVPVGILSHLARIAKKDYEDRKGLELTNMSVWPFSWLSLNMLIAILVMFCAAFIFPSVLLVIAATVVGVLVTYIRKEIRNRFRAQP